MLLVRRSRLVEENVVEVVFSLVLFFLDVKFQVVSGIYGYNY